jgi:uncharacterized protein YecT (DUF1311 family)
VPAQPAEAPQPARAESSRAVASGRLSEDASESAPGASRRDSGGGARPLPDGIQDPFKIPPSPIEAPSALGARDAVPSPRCRLASTADQRACLAAYVAAGDVPLDRAFNALVSELRRVQHTPLGAPDPPGVQRIRIEQRAWLSIRESECSRSAPPGGGPFWAQAQSRCFGEMASARAGELMDAVKRLRHR